MMRGFSIAAWLLAVAVVLPKDAKVRANHAKISIDPEFDGKFEDELVMLSDSPTDLEFSPDGKYLFLTQKEGKVFYSPIEDIENGNAKPKEIFDLNKKYDMCFNGARGLSSIGIHPEFPAKPWVYLYHNINKHGDCGKRAEYDGDGGAINRLSRYTMDVDNMEIDPDSEVVFFNTMPLWAESHNSGDIAFGKDGHLYITIGDLGTRVKTNEAGVAMPQALDRIVGKLVRLTEDGEIPPDNPYVGPDSKRCKEKGLTGDPNIKCQEIYANGLRNPYRFAFNPNVDHTQIYINEVGRNQWERILEAGTNFKGANYGFPWRQGHCDTGKTSGKSCGESQYDDAIHWYAHDEEDGGACTGGAFYPNDAGWPEEFRDTYFYAEYAYGGIYRMSKGGSGCPYPQCDPPISPFTPTLKTFSATKKIVSLQFGPHKGGQALYYMTRGATGIKGEAGLFRIAYTGSANRNPKAIAKAENSIGFAPLVVEFDGTESFDPDGDGLMYEWDFDGDGQVDSTEAKPTFTYMDTGTFNAVLVVTDGKGGKATTTVRIDADNTPPRPKILSPRNGDTFAVNDVFTLVGEAFDGEDGVLPDTALTWEVRQHHNNHYHPFLDPGTPGNNFDLWPAPEPEDFDASLTSYLAILLTATDSKGLSATTEIRVNPKVVEIDLDSVPRGMQIIANGDEFVTPATITTWENHKFEIEAPMQALNGKRYGFESWSDGGDEKHSIVVPASKPDTFVATFGEPTSQRKPIISSPRSGDTFAVGDVFSLQGQATDEAGNAVDDSDLVWEVKFNNGISTRDFLRETSGNGIVTDAVPNPDTLAAAADAYFQVYLTAYDKSGTSQTSSVIVRPEIVEIDLDTAPSGLEILINSQDVKTPTTIKAWKNDEFNIKARSQSMDGIPYKFQSWSNSESRSHKINAQNDQKLVAAFASDTPVAISDISENTVNKVGDKVMFTGAAKNADGSMIPPESLSWELRMFNNADSSYRALSSKKGKDFAFTIPDPKIEEAATSHLEVVLTATDSNGAAVVNKQIIQPTLSDISLDTVPSGLTVLVDGIETETPAIITTWQHDRLKFEAPSQKKNNVDFAWYEWSVDERAQPTFEYITPRPKNNGSPREIVATFGDPATAPQVKSMEGTGTSLGMLVGIIVGVWAFVALLAAAAFVVLSKKKRKSGIVNNAHANATTSDPFKNVDLDRLASESSSASDTYDDDVEGASDVDPSLCQESVAQSSVRAPSESSFMFPTPVSLSKYLNSANTQSGISSSALEADTTSPFSPSYISNSQQRYDDDSAASNLLDNSSMASSFRDG